MTWGDDESIEKELEALEKVGSEIKSEMTTRLKRRITSVDGNSEQSYVNNFVDNEFFAVDERNGVIKWKQNLNSNLRPTFADNLLFFL